MKKNKEQEIKINKLNVSIEKLNKDLIDLRNKNKNQISEIAQLRIELTKIKVNNHNLISEIEKIKSHDCSNNISVENNSYLNFENDLKELKNKNQDLEEENIYLRSEIEQMKVKYNLEKE